MEFLELTMTLSPRDFPLPRAADWKSRCENDGEFMMAARHWDGGLRLDIGGDPLELFLNDGVLSDSTDHADGIVGYAGEIVVWEKLLKKIPERFHNDLMANLSSGLGITREGDPLVHAQYFAAIARAVELLRPKPDRGETLAHDHRPVGYIDAPVGRYVHIELLGHDHRIYFEEAGQGIPVLLQHTAGAHGSQWRHLFENTEITDRFRLIAYDLPYHGKSVPPVSADWWDEKYELKGDFLRSIPVKLSEALGLDQPVFMGCSVGGLLALDLAHKHADVFRAVISLEGALTIAGEMQDFDTMWHPQVSNEYKARMMDGVMSPTSPKAYRKETSFVYSSGWPPAFVGDLYYYVADYDLRDHAHEINTNEVGVHILSGEYDYSGTSELGQAAHAAIKGSTWQEMKGVGHFPMSENPEAFFRYLIPILDRIS
jgi:pimeloyl-ACP methyl ester carboxylesterase